MTSVLDWSSTAAWLGIFTTLTISIITPAITTYLNNKFQLKLKEKELIYSQKETLCEKKYSVYEGFLQNIGKCLQMSTIENISLSGTYLYELYLYLPEEHWQLLDSLIHSLEQEDFKTAQTKLIEISKVLSKELTSSELNINLKD